MLFPATTGSGAATLVTDSSPPLAWPTTTEAEAVLLDELGSLAEELTDAVSVTTVPFAVPELTLVTREKVAAVPPFNVRSVQTTFPVPPVPGVVQDHPAG